VELIEKLACALKHGRHIFVFGNGGSAANSSTSRRTSAGCLGQNRPAAFRVLSLTETVSWMTALGNDLRL